MTNYHSPVTLVILYFKTANELTKKRKMSVFFLFILLTKGDFVVFSFLLQTLS